MNRHILVLALSAIATTSLSGCLAIAPLATVGAIQEFEKATGHPLGQAPAPATPTAPNAADPQSGAPTGVSAGASTGAPTVSDSMIVGKTDGPTGAATETPGTSTPTGAEADIDPRLAGQVTLNLFNQVQAGMSYEQVKDIFGRDGQLTPSSRVVMYTWYNPNGSNARIVFSAKRVASKVQERLSQ